MATTLFLVVLAFRFDSRDPQTELSASEMASFAIIATVYVLTLGTGLVLRRGVGTRALAWAQIGFDLALAAAVVLVSGGTDSPFTVLFLLAIVGGSVLLGVLGARVAAVGSALAYVGVLGFQLRGGRGLAGPLVLNASTQLLAQLLIALLSGYVAEQLSRAGGRLSDRERDLRRLTELQNRIVGAMPSGLVTCEANGRVTYVNPAARSMLGLSSVEQDLGIERLMPGVLKLRPGRRSELSVQTPRGERTLGLSVTPLADESQSSLIVFQDLTELRRLEGELDRLDRLADLGRMSAQLAHEVRNPLASMRGAAQLLAGDLTQTPQERLARLIVTEADRLSGLVEGYLRLARPPPPDLAVRRVDLIAAETVEMLRADPAFRSTGIEEVLSEASARVDQDQLKQVLINLLRNAAAAAGEDGRVRVRVAPDQQGARLEVWDSAGAISPEDLPRIFEPFFTRRAGGTGLGLSTVKAIVYAHGGTIDVTSTPAAGTTFSVRLPANPGA
ncbi:MAG: ATP-binding protein [Myxococcota bacterium]